MNRVRSTHFIAVVLLAPDRCQRRPNIGRGDLRHLPAAEPGDHVNTDRRHPLAALALAAQFRLSCLECDLGHVFEGRIEALPVDDDLLLRKLALGNRIAPIGQNAGPFVPRLSCRGQGHVVKRSDTHLPPPAEEAVAIGPLAAAAFLDQDQPAAVLELAVRRVPDRDSGQFVFRPVPQLAPQVTPRWPAFLWNAVRQRASQMPTV